MQLWYYFFLFLLFCIENRSIATEYMYPVASLDNETILYIHQTAPHAIQLFEWNTITNESEQALWSLFNPAEVQLLPGNKGFSFIDNGRLRIKSFVKRTAKTIDFDEPIFNINGLYWLDEHICYCSAQYNNHFLLFQLHDDGRVNYLVCRKNKDCMYPQKIGNQLFYIEREKNELNNFNYAIMQTTYSEDAASGLVISFYDEPIIFLNMISENEGFVIGYKKDYEKQGLVYFFYYHLIYKEKVWHKVFLFSFIIPSYLFLENNEDRLFESILPLLPRIINNKIYFVDCSNNENNFLELYYYDLETMDQNKVDIQRKGHSFVPVRCGRQLCCGGSETLLFF